MFYEVSLWLRLWLLLLLLLLWLLRRQRRWCEEWRRPAIRQLVVCSRRPVKGESQGESEKRMRVKMKSESRESVTRD